MLKKLLLAALGKDLEIREKMFRMIILLGSVLAVAGIAECIVLVDARIIIAPLLIMLCILLIAMFATFCYGKFEISAVLVGLMLVTVVFPAMFFLSGGIEGGAAVWFVLEIFYIFVMFSGKRLVAFLILSLLTNGIVYIAGCVYPEHVVALQSRGAAFGDSYFAISIVGIAGGLLLKYQIRLFETERAVSLSQKEELEKASNAKNAFFTNMSHEIRTPINAIIGLDEMILRESGEKEIREYAGNIQSAGKMLLNLVNDILDLSQMEAKKMEIIPAEYKTQTLFEELIDIIQIRMREKKLEFFVDIDENLPTALIGDEKRIKQVLLNILTNAVKYTETGSVTLTVRSEPLGGGAVNLKVSVADTGIGIRKEDLEYLFESFRRVNEKKITHIEGSGLGMSIVKQLLDLMGGEITVDSIYKKGSVFTVILRQEVAVGRPIGKVRFWESGGSGEHYQYRQSFEAPEARVLIVDDNEMNAMVTTQLLKATRVQADVAKNGMECLKKTKQKYYHVILMDYMMPEMNGVETLNELRKQENGLCRETPVIVLTANTLSDARELYEENRFDGYLEKPIQSAMLEAQIMKLLPEEIIEYSENPISVSGKANEIQQISGRKRKNIYITADCVCDLPEELLEKYDIKLVYFYIRTKRGRFADTKEIDSGNLSMYLTESDGEVCADSVSVEEYEAFFSEALSQADHVIHISMAANTGKGYGNAAAAAKGFNHVHVIDSGQMSCGEGMIVLYAAKLAAEGYHTGDICARLEKMKHRVMASYLLPGIDIYYQNGYTNKLTYYLGNMFQLHPVIRMKQSRPVIRGMLFGNLQGAWKRRIHVILWNKRKINTDIVLITHVGCSVSQQELIKEEVLKCVRFERVIVQKASFSVACSAGVGAIGISYYLND